MSKRNIRCRGKVKEDKAATNPQKPYRTGISTPSHQKATATKLVTARLLRASLTDTLNVDGENEIVVEVKAATFDKAADFDI